MAFYKNNYFSRSFNLSLINHKQTKDGITMIAVKMKNTPQSPFNQSTKAPDDDARVVLPAVPIEARSAYCVAVYVLSTSNEIKATKATVAKAAAISSNITATANSNSDLSLHANRVNNKFVAAINTPAINIAFKTPDLITKRPPSNVKITVVIHPNVFE